MADPSWASVGSRVARYRSAAQLLFAHSDAPAFDHSGLAAWAARHPWRQQYHDALTDEAWKLDEAMLYLWTRDDGETISAWRVRALAGQLHDAHMEQAIVQYVGGHAQRAKASKPKRTTRARPRRVQQPALFD